jgi:hypothetical protein
MRMGKFWSNQLLRRFVTVLHFDTSYRFYDLHDEEKKALVGKWFTTKIGNSIYFPVELTEE